MTGIADLEGVDPDPILEKTPDIRARPDPDPQHDVCQGNWFIEEKKIGKTAHTSNPVAYFLRSPY